MVLCVDPARPIMPFKVEDVDKFGLDEYDGLTVMEENERRRKEAEELGIPDEEVPYIDYGQFGDEGDFDGTGEIVDMYWYVQYLTPNATIIDEYVSPYECGCPITVVKYPYVNGEVHSYISDGLEMQRFYNRMWVLDDATIRSAAKGALAMDTRATSDDQTPEEMRLNRGTLTKPGVNSPYRDRPIEESLDLFRRMRAGEFPDGAMTLRAKIDLTSNNFNLRDPVIYRRTWQQDKIIKVAGGQVININDFNIP